MYEAPDLSGYDTSGVDASGGPSSAPSIGPGSNSGDGAPGSVSVGDMVGQFGDWLAGASGSRPPPALQLGNPVVGMGWAVAQVMGGLLGWDSVGPMGAFPGDAVSVTADPPREAIFAEMFGKVDGPPAPLPTGVQTLSGTPRAADGLPVNPASLSDYMAFPAVSKNWATLQAGMVPAGTDPRALMGADQELSLWLENNPAPSRYGPLQLEVSKAPSIIPLLLAGLALLFLNG